VIVAAVVTRSTASIGTEDLREACRLMRGCDRADSPRSVSGPQRVPVDRGGHDAGAATEAGSNEGMDANLRMGRFLARLDQLERRSGHGPAIRWLAAVAPLGAPRRWAGLSTYARLCKLEIERRTIPARPRRKS